ncbi:MAG: ABC-3 protein [Microgenomates group bacterium GW2011_GWC1_39_7b]|uniref:ABC-3 protein n=3 Tax=Candidatus Woeseibacteriota TaxID=1752722 RepID=A0A0G0PQZ0_9BACT|nr:MAG: ABC-3 protein [Candidatus Woesebacteria bacterium GW2011_GWB1_39_10]KKR25976.1 MAG: ABC-3 protein [Microgenomates group bacterium GW2011_GWC1_39_7b]KKR74380.1 MAG: ABC-3 protein [Candidatus Woesebacteria bacterium GW2011_GWA2_40_7]KKS90762.1 MAG: ABC-3 protein [Candidatus Woesebacteria bacterium GW2011_GWA1_43_12]
MNTNLGLILLVGALIGATSGYLGSFMVLKRMSLVGDALSHVALPGIAIAITLGINPLLGALVALVIATFGIWYLGEHSEVYPEALVGVFFTASLSLGLLLTPEPELLEALFGNIDKIGIMDSVLTIIGAIIIFIVTFIFSKKLLLGIVSEDLAKSQGINVAKVNLVYLLLVALVVALGVKFLGTLLTGAMVIIPAVTAKNLSKSIKQFQLYSIILGVVSSFLGIFLAKYIGISSGPAVVLTSISIFLLSYIFKNK